ncbi:metallophosphoesterase [Halomarina pelagica]|uniref:metallophosphoesterase n=1 Tax=Halomarina pelagica TaxID=2961599 RepID=UPI0020C30187|nr:metallophosphoesterase [Halomarina sp. BND7]
MSNTSRPRRVAPPRGRSDGGTVDGGTVDGEASDGSADLPPLSPDLAAHHERIDAADWERIAVVGDVHGCHDELLDLLDRLDPGEDDLLVFVGDLIRKGPASRAVVELVRDSPNMRAVRGNNEQKYVDDRVECPALAPVAEYIESLPVALSWDGAMVVHGGLDPRRPLVEHTIDDLETTRAIPPGNGYDGPFWFETYRGPPRVFFGHTVLDAPVVSEWAVGLDTGCVYGGSLTAYDCSTGEVLSVPAHETYRERADRKILNPGATDAGTADRP